MKGNHFPPDFNYNCGYEFIENKNGSRNTFIIIF